jgi:hypothetical protein
MASLFLDLSEVAILRTRQKCDILGGCVSVFLFNAPDSDQSRIWSLACDLRSGMASLFLDLSEVAILRTRQKSWVAIYVSTLK